MLLRIKWISRHLFKGAGGGGGGVRDNLKQKTPFSLIFYGDTA